MINLHNTSCTRSVLTFKLFMTVENVVCMCLQIDIILIIIIACVYESETEFIIVCIKQNIVNQKLILRQSQSPFLVSRENTSSGKML